MTTEEQENIIIDFVHGGCLDTQGNPMNIDCQQIWENYQDELHQPGCRACIRKSITTKYFQLVKSAYHFALKNPGQRMALNTKG